MSAPSDANVDLRRFTAALRQLRLSAEIPSARALAKETFFSHTTIAEALKGTSLPSLEVTLAIVRACGAEPEPWAHRWNELRDAGRPGEMYRGPDSAAVDAESPWPRVSVTDGADPDEAGCSRDAKTVGARRIALKDQRRIIGVIELRYSAKDHAAWGRFDGFNLLNNLATGRDDVIVIVDAVRESDGRRVSFRQQYSFDYHWCDLVTTGEGRFFASATVQFGGEIVAYNETDRVTLP
jgi:hypothetical protein